MSGRFYNSETGYNFDSGDGLDLELDQNNYWLWLSRAEPYMDMAQVTDPRDDESWTWFRCDVGDETFNSLDMMARKIGSVVLRETPTEDVQDVFHARHSFEDIEEHLEELNDEPRE